MRLLNTSTLQFHEYFGPVIPPYAILSHRWEAEELTYQEVLHYQNIRKAGWNKVKQCCIFAASRGFDLVWIDTCCIDKTSSAELTEAINSMFRWYKEAYECYAYLCDVAATHETEVQRDQALEKSKWFTRGWTLQELLAPSSVFFVANDWTTILGSVSSLDFPISTVTGIDILYLQKRADCFSASVATRMSWMSKRQCTRIEDLAYSLMGIFNVHMPTLYGEGQSAFLRLQLEILKMSNDESIFAWTLPEALIGKDGTELGLLASSPAFFPGGRFTRYDAYDSDRPPYLMTNRGLQFEPLVLPLDARDCPRAFQDLTLPLLVVPLNCVNLGSRIFILLQENENSGQANAYMRAVPEYSFAALAAECGLDLHRTEKSRRIANKDLYRKLIYIPQHHYHQKPIPYVFDREFQNAWDTAFHLEEHRAYH
jgi:hypothetical protein